METFAEVLDGFAQDGDAFTGEVPDAWTQGRTAYGGLTAAIALLAVERAHEGLAPLRSALVSFVGPAAGRLSVTSRVLRRGRSVAFIEAEVTGEAGIAAVCQFCFGAARPSSLSYEHMPPPNVGRPEEGAAFPVFEGMPAFVNNFERRAAGDRPDPFAGSDLAEIMMWARFREQRPAPGAVDVLAIADILPPAALALGGKKGPISSMTWIVNFLVDDPAGGWSLAYAAAEDARDGYSSQNMLLWDETLRPVAAARQSVAVFF